MMKGRSLHSTTAEAVSVDIKTYRLSGSWLFHLPWHWISAALLFCAALCLNLYRLGEPSIWFDEAFSVELARQPLPLLWQIIFGPEPNMELYYLCLHYWLGFTAWLGWLPVEAVVRLPSAVFAALSTVIVFLIARRFVKLPVAILAAALYLSNDLQLVYAQQARSYAMELLFICLAWYALLRILTDKVVRIRSWIVWIVYVLAITLAVYVHLFSLFILLAQYVALALLATLPGPWRERVRSRLRAAMFGLLAIALLIVPMLLESLHGSKTSWLPAASVSELRQFVVTFSGSSEGYTLSIALCFVIAILVAFLSLTPPAVLSRMFGRQIWLRRVLQRLSGPGLVVWLLLCWFFVPLLVSYVISYGPLHIFSTRYLVVLLPPLFLLVAIGVSALPWRFLQMAVSLLLLVQSFVTVPLYYQSAQVEDWNSTTHWLLNRYQEDDGLVCYDNEISQGCQISVEYYLHAYSSATESVQFTEDSPGAFSWRNYGPADPDAGFAAALRPSALAAYGAKHDRLFFIVGRVPEGSGQSLQIAQSWLDRHYQLVDQISTRTVSIRLYHT